MKADYEKERRLERLDSIARDFSGYEDFEDVISDGFSEWSSEDLVDYVVDCFGVTQEQAWHEIELVACAHSRCHAEDMAEKAYFSPREPSSY